MIRICIPNAKASRNRRVLSAYIFNCFAQGQVISKKKDFSVLICLPKRDILRKSTIETSLCVQDGWGNSSNSQVRGTYTFFFGEISNISNVIGN